MATFPPSEAAFPGVSSLLSAVRAHRALLPVLATCVVICAVLGAAAPADARPGPAPDRTSRLEARRVDRVRTPKPAWFDCGGYFVPGARCGTVLLPLDYDRPRGAQVEIALLKIPAARPAARIGTLFVNPGGPGGSGVEFAAAAATYLDQSVLDRFDVVGFDPRGTNLSDNVRCWPDADRQDRALTGLRTAFPTGAAQNQAAVRSARAFGRACSASGRPLAASMSTAQVARDMDVLRRAVGDRTLSYLGFSYGTYLGQVYANLFPDRVRAAVLDGVLDPLAWAGTASNRAVPQTTRLRSGEASAKALREILARCSAAGPDYCLLARRGEPQRVHAAVMASVRRSPIVLRDPDFTMTYTYPVVVGTLLDMLYSPQGSDDVDGFLSFLDDLRSPTRSPARTAAARAGLRRITVQRMAFRATGGLTARHRAAFGRFAFPYPNGPEAFQSVLCTDGVNPPLAGRWPGYALTAGRRAPGFGPLWTWASAPCASATWTARDEDAYRGPFTRRTVQPVLVVGATWDPATPYGGAVTAARLLPNSRLLTSVSWGHTALGTSACLSRAVDAYLLSGAVPVRGARCVGDAQPFTTRLDEADGGSELDGGDLGAGPRSRTAGRETTEPASGRGRPPIVPLRP